MIMSVLFSITNAVIIIAAFATAKLASKTNIKSKFILFFILSVIFAVISAVMLIAK